MARSSPRGPFLFRANSERLVDADEQGAPNAVLRRANADARAIAQLVDPIEGVDERDARVQLAEALPEVEGLRHRQVDGGVARQMLGVGEPVAQAAAVQGIRAQRQAVAEAV